MLRRQQPSTTTAVAAATAPTFATAAACETGLDGSARGISEHGRRGAHWYTDWANESGSGRSNGRSQENAGSFPPPPPAASTFSSTTTTGSTHERKADSVASQLPFCCKIA